MPSEPVPADPGRDESRPRTPSAPADPLPADPLPAEPVPCEPQSCEPVPWEPVITRPDPMTEENWQAWCDATADQEEPPDPDEEEPDPDGLPGPWEYNVEQVVAECRRVTAEEAALAARAARMGLPAGRPVSLERRGPGQPGSARPVPGEHRSPAASFAAGLCLDVMPGCTALAGFAAEAAGDDDRYDGASDDELAGAISAWDRVEAHAAARKHAAVAEFIR